MGRSTLTDDERAWLMEFLSNSGPGRDLIHLRQGDTLYRKGTAAKYVYMVQRGQIRLVAADNHRTQEIVGPNRWLFESHELGHVYLGSAIALTDAGLIAFKAEGFLAMLREHPALHVKFLEDTAERVAEKNNTLDPANKRLARLFNSWCSGKDKAIITSPLRFAELIGTTRQTTTRIIKEFEAAGLMTKVGKDRHMLHGAALEQFLRLPGNGEDE
jgi:CRP-like cAMP-binding protein